MARSVQEPNADETRDRAQDQDHAVTEAIARETDTPPEVVQEMYDQTLSSLASEAKITQFLGVLATRHVRMMLRRH